MAGGSLPKEEVVAVLNGSGAVGAQVLGSFELGPVAVGTRLGNQYGALGGARMGPYTIPVKVKGAPGDFNMELVLETKGEILGPDGKPLADGGLNAPEGSKISETVTTWRVQPRAVQEEEVKPLQPGALPPEALAGDPVQDAKNLYNEVMEMQLKVESLEYELQGEPVSGSLTRWRDAANNVRRVKLSYGGEHSAVVNDVIYDSKGRPRFILSRLGSWNFVPGKPNETVDKVRERRFYIGEDGIVVRVLEKYYEAQGNDEAFKKAADAAQNLELHPASYASRKYVVIARDMLDAKKSDLQSLTLRHSDAGSRLLDPAPPLDNAQWLPLSGKFDVTFPFTDELDSAVTKYLIDLKLVAPSIAIQEGNYSVHYDTIQLIVDQEGKDNAAVVVTATGLPDDEIQAERFLVKLVSVGKDRMGIQFIGKQVKNWPGRDPQGWRK